MSDYFILLDLGGTYIKSARKYINASSIENVVINQTPAFIQNNFRHILELSVLEIQTRIDEHLSQQISKIDFCRGILVTGQMGGYQLCQADFSLSDRFVSWQDLRGLDSFILDSYDGNGYDWAYKNWTGIDKAKTGYEVRQNTPYVGLTTDLMREPGKAIGKGFVSLILGTSRNLVTSFFPYIHTTDAASSGMMNIVKPSWMKEKLPDPGPQLIFPKITDEIHCIGTNNESKSGVYTPVGDQQASLKGMNLSFENIIFNIGTGGQVSKMVEAYDENLLTQHRPYFESKYIQTVTHLPSGRLLNEFISFIFNGDLSAINYQKFNKWGGSPGSVIKFETQDTASIFSDFRKSELKDKNRELLARSFFEHLANHYSQAYQLIDPNGTLKPIIGGGMGQKMNSLATAIEKKINKKFIVSNSEETTLEGLGKLTNSLV